VRAGQSGAEEEATLDRRWAHRRRARASGASSRSAARAAPVRRRRRRLDLGMAKFGSGGQQHGGSQLGAGSGPLSASFAERSATWRADRGMRPRSSALEAFNLALRPVALTADHCTARADLVGSQNSRCGSTPCRAIPRKCDCQDVVQPSTASMVSGSAGSILARMVTGDLSGITPRRVALHTGGELPSGRLPSAGLR